MFRKTRNKGAVLHALHENGVSETTLRFDPSVSVSAPDLSKPQSPALQVIAHQIIPKLKLIHHDQVRSIAKTLLERGAIAEFCALAIGTDGAAAVAYFEMLRASGHSLQTLFVDFLEPAARSLGVMWEEDRCDFVDVTLGLSRMQEILVRLNSVAARAPIRDTRYRALLLSAPGEMHGFGIDMVATLMRGTGWDVKVEMGLGPDRCAAAVAHEWIGVVGITLAIDARLGSVARAIVALRRASLNPRLAVMVGGAAFAARPDRVVRVGADAGAIDAPTAVALAQKLLLR